MEFNFYANYYVYDYVKCYNEKMSILVLKLAKVIATDR